MENSASKVRIVDFLVFGLLILVVAAQIFKDPSPWRDAFYESARFDGQLGIAANYTQAAIGRPVDCLIWLGLPGIAMGGLAVKITGLAKNLLTKENKIIVSETESYRLLNRVSKTRQHSVSATAGVVLLVCSTYVIVLGITSKRGLSFLASFDPGNDK